jgi:hypothetical protein
VNRIPVTGLRPADRQAPLKPGLDMLRRAGGQIAYVDAEGKFQIATRTPGAYWVLILSNHFKRTSNRTAFFPGDEPTFRQYFDDHAALIGDSAYILFARKLEPDRPPDPIQYHFEE